MNAREKIQVTFFVIASVLGFSWCLFGETPEQVYRAVYANAQRRLDNDEIAHPALEASHAYKQAKSGLPLDSEYRQAVKQQRWRNKIEKAKQQANERYKTPVTYGILMGIKAGMNGR